MPAAVGAIAMPIKIGLNRPLRVAGAISTDYLDSDRYDPGSRLDQLSFVVSL
jgi:hypothetical protein